LGLRFRTPALLAASFLLACGNLLFGSFSGWPFGATAGQLAGLLVTLQICYGLGVWLSTRLVSLFGRYGRHSPLDRGK
jgi:hypothetical protein